MEDHFLFGGLASGDDAVVRQIYQLHLEKIVRHITRYQGTRAEAMDVFQEALTQILIRYRQGKLDIHSSFGGYLMNTCKYLWMSTLRQRQHHASLDDVDVSVSDHEALYIEQDVDTIIYRVLQRTRDMLSDTCHKLMTLMEADISAADMAIQLNMSNPNTVYRRKFACLKRWRELIERDEDYHQWKTYKFD